MRTATVLFVLFLSAPLHSQNLEKILLPVAIKTEVAGAFGSSWRTPFTIVNHGSENLVVYGLKVPCPVGPPCVPPEVVPNATLSPDIELPDFPLPGECYCTFLRVAPNRMDDLAAELRIQDVSRQSQTWGTELPIVRERDARLSKTELLDIPVGADFRTLVRFYDFDPGQGHQIRVRVFQTDPSPRSFFNQPPDPFLEEQVVTLLPSHAGAALPGYAQFYLSSLSHPTTTGRLRLELEPVSAGLRFWAFASVTNNETQHVTTIVAH